MRKMEMDELKDRISRRKGEELLTLQDLEFDRMDFSGMDLHRVDFSVCLFVDSVMDGADLSESSLFNACLDGCSLRGVRFVNADLRGTCMRRCDMTGADISGADLLAAVLENADLTDVISSEDTKWFRMHCPESGPILGYKKCVNDRIVQLLIPADAKRTSATMPCCRCNKAKVLTIKNFEETESYDEAWSLVDENFVYRKGQWVEVKDFNEDRWFDSTTGIHFWLTRAEAMGY